MIKVLVVNDRGLVRIDIIRMLADIEGLRVVGQADCGENCLKLARELKPDAVLIGAGVPGIGGLETTRELLRSQPDIEVVVVIVCEEDPFPIRLIQAGITGCMTKGVELEEMAQAIRRVFAGQCYISPQITQQLALRSFQPQQYDSPFDSLSEREIQVALMITNCHKAQSISDKLCLPPETVDIYHYHIFRRLSITSDMELALFTARHGMVDAVGQMGAVFDADAFLATCSNRPGVYRAFDAGAKLPYVGKAGSLRKRLASYFRKPGLAPKTAALVAHIA